MDRTQQPRKRRAPGTDLPSGASRSFNKPDATGHGGGRGSGALTRYICTAACTTPVAQPYYLYVLAVRCVPRFGVHEVLCLHVHDVPQRFNLGSPTATHWQSYTLEPIFLKYCTSRWQAEPLINDPRGLPA